MVGTTHYRAVHGRWMRAAAAAAGAALAAQVIATPAAMATAGGSHVAPCPLPVAADSRQGSTAFSADPTGAFEPVSFDSETFALQPESRTTLDELGNALHSEQLRPYRFAAIAHVEPLGDPSREKKATVLMATAVADYLIERRDVEPDRVVWSACGATHSGQAANGPEDRRIVILNLGAR